MTIRIAATGMGMISPIGNTVEEYWRNLTAGVSGAAAITHFDTTGHDVRIAAEVKGFDPGDYMDAKTAKRMNRFAHFAVAAASQAIADAGLDIASEDRTRIAVVMNTGGGGLSDTVDGAYQLEHKGPGRVSPMLVPSLIPNMGACQVGMMHGILGPTITSIAACASGIYSFIEAKRLLRGGEADVVVCGSSEAAIIPLAIAAMANIRALSTRNDEPQRASRPFDADRAGFLMGEGGGAVILETEEHAKRRGARIVAELCGGAATADAYHITAPDPTGESAARAISLAMRDAGVDAAEVDYVVAHGTGTPLNDVSETVAIKRALGEHAHSVAISSPKSMVGHLMGAAGAISAAAALLAIRDGVIPPTINLERADPECDLDYVPNVARRAPVRVAMANGFGFGGQNGSIVFRAWED